MKTDVFVRSTRIEAPAGEVFRWHARPGAFERLTPPWEPVELVEQTGGIADGARVVLRIGAGPARLRWVAEHRDYVEGEQFRDVQVEGPFARWVHTHRFEQDGPDACTLEDHIEYALPAGALGRLAGGAYARAKLDRVFAYRHRTTAGDLSIHSMYKGRPAMKILVTGSTGLIGSALIPFLTTGGHSVVRLVRSPPAPGGEEVHWDPDANAIDAVGLEGADAVVHLAGENVFGRWTDEKKARIRDSRVGGTTLLSETLARLTRPPSVFVCASAIGYYGDRGDEILTEESAPGSGFLAGVCRAWETATGPAAAAGIRVVNTRFGIVLSPGGGALATMLTPFKMGAGGKVGSGDQYVSWISIDDAIGAILHALQVDSLRGPVNVVAPNPVTNARLAETLGGVLSRPAAFTVPAFAVRLALGAELADETVFASQRVEPSRLLSSGYTFRHTQLEGALRHLLGK
jgi:uncharacterized protein (TIGR01777 family)